MLALAGCISSTTLITVRPDASGTIEQITTMNPERLARLTQMIAGFQKQAGAEKSTPVDLFSESGARGLAAKMGEGVTYISSQKIRTKDAEGIKALYAFSDITKIRINQKPSAPSGDRGQKRI